MIKESALCCILLVQSNSETIDCFVIVTLHDVITGQNYSQT